MESATQNVTKTPAGDALSQVNLAQYNELFAGSDRSAESQDAQDLRSAALARFEATGFPSRQDEEWRQTNIAPITKTKFARGEGTSADVSDHLFDGCDHLVFVDGRLSQNLSGSPEGVTVLPMREALEQGPELTARLGQLVPEGHAFAELNTALFDDGVFLQVAADQRMTRPLQIHFQSTGKASGGSAASFPRNLLMVERGGEGRVIETYGGADQKDYMTSAVTEIHVGENASLRHVKVMREGDAAYHISFQGVRLERSARLHSVAVNQGGLLVRNDLRSLLDGEGIDCVLNGLVLGKNRQLVDNHLWMEHAKPNCFSHQLYKGVLGGSSRAVFSGRIFVHREAQKTDAVQTNRNLLLTDTAMANSNPQLEIFADDVKCTHASTIGQLEEEALFYMRSRGIDTDVAKGLLVYAFASEVLQEIELDALKEALEQVLIHELVSGA